MTAAVLFRGAGLSFAIRVGGVAIALVMQIALARALSTEGYGNYAYAVQLAGLLAVIGSLGFAQAAVRVIPAANVDRDTARRQAFIRSGVVITLLVSAALAAGALILARIWGAGLDEPFRTVLLPVTILLLTALTLLRLGQEIMRGDRNVLAAQIGEQVLLPLGLLALAGGALVLGTKLRVPFVLTFQMALTGLMAAALIAVSLRRRAGEGAVTPPRTAPGRTAPDGLTAWIGIGLPLAAAGLMSGFLARGDLIVLGFIAPPEDIAVYAAAARVAGLMIFGLAAINTIAAPLFSELWHARDRDSLQSRVDVAAALAVLATLPVFAALMLFPHSVLGLFGPDFTAAAPALRVLALGQLANALTGPTGPLMVATGQNRAYAALTFLGIVVTVAAILTFEWLFGLTGAAIGTTLGLILLNGSLVWRIRARTGLRSLATLRGLKSLAGLAMGRLTQRGGQG